MAEGKVRHLVSKPGIDGPRHYWQPTPAIRKLGFALRRLDDDRAAAEAEAERLNREVDEVRHGAGRAGVVQRAAPGRRARDGWSGVYVIGCGLAGRPIKIGIAVDPIARLGSLQAGSAEKLRLLWFAACPQHHAVRVERFLHRAFRADRKVGEWFMVEPQRAALAILKVLHLGPKEERPSVGRQTPSDGVNIVQIGRPVSD